MSVLALRSVLPAPIAGGKTTPPAGLSSSNYGYNPSTFRPLPLYGVYIKALGLIYVRWPRRNVTYSVRHCGPYCFC